MSPLDITSITCIADVKAHLGEGPLWVAEQKALYWVDIKGLKLLRYDETHKTTQSFSSPRPLSSLGLRKDGGLIATSDIGFCTLRLQNDTVRLTHLIDPEDDVPQNRFNDGKIGPDGCYWAGTMDDAEKSVSGVWWHLSPGGEVRQLIDGFKVTNGPAFDIMRNRVFLTDSALRTVYVAPITMKRKQDLDVFLQFRQVDGYPDGMEIDTEGCLWIAFWDGACMRRFSPDGTLLQTISLPIPRPTSLAIGNDGIYVTSARIGLDTRARSLAPLSGGLFKISTGKALAHQARYFG